MDFSQSPRKGLREQIPPKLTDANLQQVDLAAHHRTRREFQTITAWVVGFEANQPYPRRFAYRACPGITEKGRCNKSLESSRSQCGHGYSEHQGVWTFRFNLLLCDNSGPLWATTFDAMSGPLGYKPADFVKLPQSKQESIVFDWVSHFPYCAVKLLSTERGDVNINALKVLRWRVLFLPAENAASSDEKANPQIRPIPSNRGETSGSEKTPIVIDGDDYEALLHAMRSLKPSE